MIPGQGEFGNWHPGDGKTAKAFLQCVILQDLFGRAVKNVDMQN